MYALRAHRACIVAVAVGTIALSSCASNEGPAATKTPAPSPETCSEGAAPCDRAVCAVVYVSPNGSDARVADQACTPGAPLRTLRAAVALANARGAGEVRACRGGYVEPQGVRLDGAVSLHGGYDCSHGEWTRGDLPIAPADDASERLSVLEGGAGVAALFVRGDVAREVVIDGFEIRGGATAQGSSIALQIAGKAAPRVARCRLLGGEGNATNGVGSMGVVVEDEAAPHIEESTIFGGSGSSTSGAGSIGVLIRTTGGSPRLAGNVISGGAGVGSSRVDLQACKLEYSIVSPK